MCNNNRNFGVKVGDTIRITRLDDPYGNTYVGREGYRQHGPAPWDMGREKDITPDILGQIVGEDITA